MGTVKIPTVTSSVDTRAEVNILHEPVALFEAPGVRVSPDGASPVEALEVDGNAIVEGDVTAQGDADVTGELIARGDKFDMINSNGGRFVLLTGGNGRIEELWNCRGGTSPVYEVGGEDAARMRIGPNGDFSWFRGEGSAASPGDPVDWLPLLSFDALGIYFNGGVVQVKTPGIYDDDLPSHFHFAFGGNFTKFNRYAFANGTAEARVAASHSALTQQTVGYLSTIVSLVYNMESADATTEIELLINGITASTNSGLSVPNGNIPMGIDLNAGDLVEIGHTAGTHPGLSTFTVHFRTPPQ